MFLDLCNLSAITIALPTIRTDFDVAVGDLQWVISAYALTVRIMGKDHLKAYY